MIYWRNLLNMKMHTSTLKNPPSLPQSLLYFFQQSLHYKVIHNILQARKDRVLETKLNTTILITNYIDTVFVLNVRVVKLNAISFPFS